MGIYFGPQMTQAAFNRGKGKCIAWLRERVHHDGEGCLIWPFNRGQYGYGTFGLGGKVLYAHRWMCEQVHGPAPSADHQAAHDCGNGDKGCVHPKHVFWKTPLENSQDKIAHGTTYTNKGRRRNKLTPEQVAQIRLISTVAEQNEAAKRFGVSSSMIRKIIYGKSWQPIKPWKNFADEDVRRIRSLKGTIRVAQLAAEYEVNPNTIYRIWCGRGWTHVVDAPNARTE